MPVLWRQSCWRNRIFHWRGGRWKNGGGSTATEAEEFGDGFCDIWKRKSCSKVRRIFFSLREIVSALPYPLRSFVLSWCMLYIMAYHSPQLFQTFSYVDAPFCLYSKSCKCLKRSVKFDRFVSLFIVLFCLFSIAAVVFTFSQVLYSSIWFSRCSAHFVN